MKVSVIVPVYRVEKYLSQCVDSILQQTYTNIEVILVDDGSPDSCPKLCDAYAQKDSRVKVVHKNNGGLSSARNAGVKVATGEYGIFIDSDDFWIDINGLEKIVERCKLHNADVVCFGYVKYEEDINRFTSYHNPNTTYNYSKDKDSQLDELTKKNLYIASSCDKLIRMEFLKQLSFQEGMVSEDVEWCARLLKKVHSFDFINLSFYCYRQRSGSISQTITKKNCEDLKNAIVKCALIGQEADEVSKKYIHRYTAYQFSTFIAIQAFTKEFQEECIKELKPYQYVLQEYSSSKKVKAMYIGTEIFGLKNWCKIIKSTKGIWDRIR